MDKTDPFAKMITCPEHPNGRLHWWSLRKHQAILFLNGSKFAGLWECEPSGLSDIHEHGDFEIEPIQVDYWPTPDIDRSYDVDVYVCGGPEGCGVTIDRDVADPAEDRYDAMVDMQIDMARGK